MLILQNITSSKERVDFLIKSSTAHFEATFNLEGHLEEYLREADSLDLKIAELLQHLKVGYEDKKKQVRLARKLVLKLEEFKEVILKVNKNFETILPQSEITYGIDTAIEQVRHVLTFSFELEGVSNAKHCLRKIHSRFVEKAKDRISFFKKISYLLNSPMKGRIYFEDDTRQSYNFEIVDLHQAPHSGAVIDYHEWLELITKFYKREIDKQVNLAKDQFRELLTFILKTMNPIEDVKRNFSLGEFIKARGDIYNVHINNITGDKNFSYHYYRFSSGYAKFEDQLLSKIEAVNRQVEARFKKLQAQGLDPMGFYNMNLDDFILERRVLRAVKSDESKSATNLGNILIKKNPNIKVVLDKMLTEEIRASVGAKLHSPNVCVRNTHQGYHSEIFISVIKGENLETHKKSLDEDYRGIKEIDRRTNILRLKVDNDTSIDIEVEVATLHGTMRSLQKAS